MQGDTGKSVSVWKEPEVPTSTLTWDVQADVCVIGAGMTGITCAYLLTRRGKRVVVLGHGKPGGGETSRSTAQLATALDRRYFELEGLHGVHGARLAAESHKQAIQCIEDIIREEAIDCGFERLDGFLIKDPADDLEVLQRELEAVRRAGLSEVDWVFQAPLSGFLTGPALRFPRQAQLDPMRYLSGLAACVLRRGGRIFRDALAVEVSGRDTARVKTRDGFTVTARSVVVATHTPCNDRLVLHTKQAAYRSYVIGARVPRGGAPRALIWDTHHPYRYVRPAGATPEGEAEYLLVGGEDHKTGQDEDPERRYSALEAWARERFPKILSVDYRWSGQILEPYDGVAFIGANPMDVGNVFVATGYSGSGITHAMIAGIILNRLVDGQTHEWLKLYEPSRKTLRAAGAYLRENANMAAQYSEWLTGGEVRTLEEIARGEGAVYRQGLRKAAVYRDTGGKIHACSAVCPHLGGIVAWNSAEKTWDCPCHGSRFDAFGRVLNGPADRNLSATLLEEKDEPARKESTPPRLKSDDAPIKHDGGPLP
ncbi:MAG: FAD-dependent oxidoreductase [Deltaproteobacteria bacterium]|nr:FAD-dependent oxidoreductase [Deltaproteobacteria bacterium]